MGLFKKRKLKKKIGLVNKDNATIYQYHGHANSMPKRLREYFEQKGVKFEKDDFVDIIEYVEIEISNIWKKGK